MDESQVRARVTSHFLPKFENASEGHRLEQPPIRDGFTQVLAVSKKHSGSLIMAPPFFAKNSTANIFTRTSYLIVKSHFDAVWGSDSQTKFDEWWDDAEKHGLTYSFEAVVPRILGDHGATPVAAYAVLTAVSAGDDFLSPTTLLEIAIKWRLPLNEIWYVPWSQAEVVQNALHENRWTAYDEDVDKLMQPFEGEQKAVLQRFLKHTDTQGPILEGFVLMSLDLENSKDGELDLLRLAKEYSTLMAQHYTPALNAAKELGARCLAKDADLLKTVQGSIEGNREPTSLLEDGERKKHDHKWWAIALADHGNPPLQRMFEILHRNYLPFVSLYPYNFDGSTYEEGGTMMLQVKVKSDDVFYGWKLHMAAGAAPLFRGMVVTFSKTPLPPLVPLTTVSGASRIVEIGKLKCLHYIIRTFAVRNRMRALLEDPPDVYASATTKNFCRNWSIPTSYHEGVLKILSDWAVYISRAPREIVDELTNGSYLSVLEPFLNGEVKMDLSNNSNDVCTKYFWILVDVTFKGLSTEQLALYTDGLEPRMGKMAPATGGYTIVKNVPGPKLVKNGLPIAVVAFAPEENPEDMPNPGLLKKHGAQWAHISSEKFAASYPNAQVLLKPTAESYAEFVSTLPVPEPPVIITKWLVVVAGAPPGSGKSTFFDRLAKRPNTMVVSSDLCRKKNKDFNALLIKTLVDPKHLIVGFDKNIPAKTGLISMLQKVVPLLKQDYIDVRVIIVMPNEIQTDLCWERIRSREAGHLALSIHDVGGEDAARAVFYQTFLGPCKLLLKSVCGDDWEQVIRTDAFWGDEAEIEPLLDQVFASKATAPTAITVSTNASMLGGDEGPQNTGFGFVRYIGARLNGTNLHLTLVPPNTEDLCNQYRHIGGKHIRVTLGNYFKATSKKTAEHGDIQVGFWKVTAISGLEKSETYQPHVPLYHVTDSAGISTFGDLRESRSKHAANAMEQINNLPNRTIEFDIVKFDQDPIEMDAVVTLEK